MNHVMRSVIGLIVVAGVPLVAGAQQQQGRISYPSTKTINHVDDYFGRKVSDPYRWMEDLNAPEVAQWVKAQNAVTEQFLAQCLGGRAAPFGESLRRSSLIVPHGADYVDGLQDAARR